jgi:hypothetical protein
VRRKKDEYFFPYFFCLGQPFFLNFAKIYIV